MCAEKHGPPPVCFRKSNVPCAATTLLRPPHYSTSLHSQRHARDVWTNLRMFIPFLSSICKETGSVGESGAFSRPCGGRRRRCGQEARRRRERIPRRGLFASR